MSNKTKFNDVSRVDWINWIKEGVSNKNIKYYEYNSFSSVKEIGSRNSRKVYRANWKSSRNPLALKSINEDTAEKIIYWLKVQREKHFYDNIIKFYGVTIGYQNDNSRKYMLVMEYADSGTLRRYLKENFSSLTWNDKSVIAYQLAFAISCLHDENIVHGDLHSDNVLVHQNTIKLADFGVNPERFYSDEYSLIKDDIYNIGLLLWEISSGRPPFKGENNYRSMERPIPNTPEDYITIYTDCWKDDPPTIHDIVARLEAMMERNFETSNDFQLYDFNREIQNSNSSFVEDLYSCNSEKDFYLQSNFEKNTKDFRSCDSKSNIQKPISNFAEDFYSCNSDKDIQQYISSLEDFQLHDSNSSFQQPDSERTTKDFRSRDSNSNLLSSFANDFYSCNSDKDIQQCISSLEDFQLHDSNPSVKQPRTTKDFRTRNSNSNDLDFYSYNSDMDTQQYISSDRVGKDFRLHDFNSSIQQPDSERTTKDFRSRDSNSNLLSSFAKDFYSCDSDKDIQQCISSLEEDFQLHDSNSSVKQPRITKDFRTRNSNSNDLDFYSYNSDMDTQQYISSDRVGKDFRLHDSNSSIQQSDSERTTKDFRSRDSNSNLLSSFAKDFYSCNSKISTQQYIPGSDRIAKDFQLQDSNSNFQKPISSFPKDSYSYNSDIDIQQFSSVRTTTKDFQPYNSNSNVQKPISSFAEDFYSYSSDVDIEKCISSFEEDFQLHDSNSNFRKSISSSEGNNNSYNSNVNNQQSISDSSRINSLPCDSDIENLIESINNDTSSFRNNNNKSPSDFWKYLK